VEPVYLEAKQEESEMSSAGSTQPGGFGRPRRRGGPGSSQQAKAASLPELKRVIVAFGNRLVMEEDLDRALRSVLGGEVRPEQRVSSSMPETKDISNLGVSALEHYNKAKAYLRQGDWAAYGRELENLEKILEEMGGMTKEKKE